MAAAPFYDNVMETSTTTGTGTLTLAGAVAGSQSFGAIGNANTTPMAIWEVDGSGNPSGAWEVATSCVYTVSGTTLTRGTFQSSSTGSVISFGAGTKRVAQSLPAVLMNQMAQAGLGAIQGLELVFSSTTAIIVNAGKCSVNNKFPSFAQTTYTNGSTMKDIANSTVTLAANSAYWVFISDAGVIGIEINDGTGDGQVPLFDTTFDYWKAASTGAAWRRIGKFWTGGGGSILRFSTSNCGRYRKFAYSDSAVNLVSGVNNTTFTAITITPYITGDDLEIKAFSISAPTGGAGNLVTYLSTDGGNNPASQAGVLAPLTAITAVLGFEDWLLYTGTLHYKSYDVSCLSYVYIGGFSEYI